MFAITDADRAGWQRRAVAELTAILDVHRDLPVIAWTLGSAGATLVGHVSSPTGGAQVRWVFDTWRAALMLAEHGQTGAGGITRLRAVGDHAGVRVALTGTLLDDAPAER